MKKMNKTYEAPVAEVIELQSAQPVMFTVSGETSYSDDD